MKRHIAEAVEHYIEDKRRADPNAKVTSQELTQLRESVRQEVLESEIVSRFDVNDSDPTMQYAINEGVHILATKLEKMLATRATQLFAKAEAAIEARVNNDKRNVPLEQKQKQAQYLLWNRALMKINPEDRAAVRQIFDELKALADKRRATSKSKTTTAQTRTATPSSYEDVQKIAPNA